ncbi:MAG: hypothetical protein ACFNTM_00230 [Cardiobacterium sp.]|jgi:hypothetical protein
MKKILIALLVISASSFAKEYPMRCMADPSEWSKQYSNPEKTVSKKARENLTKLTPKIEKMWQDLQKVMASDSFKAEGLGAANFQVWDEKREALSKEIQTALMKYDYINTDYTVCEQAVQYGLSFQKEYARELITYKDPQHPKVQKAEEDLMKYLKHLPKK